VTLNTVERDAELPKTHDADTTNSGLSTSVGKALAVLAAFRGDGVVLGVTQIAERARIPKSTAHRILAVLVEHGYVERDDARYQLSRHMFELGNQVAECRPHNLRSLAAPYLSSLYENTHATIHLAVLESTDVMYVDKICGHDSVKVPSQIGGRIPALCTALGKAMIAVSDEEVRARAFARPIPRLTPRTLVNPNLLNESLDTICRTGIAHDIEGVRLGVRCIAAPVVRLGRPIGAISMSFALSSRIPARAEALLKHAVDSISTPS
jgi:DNA-binding IclR family transcriptional regulator